MVGANGHYGKSGTSKFAGVTHRPFNKPAHLAKRKALRSAIAAKLRGASRSLDRTSQAATMARRDVDRSLGGKPRAMAQRRADKIGALAARQRTGVTRLELRLQRNQKASNRVAGID